MVNAIEQWGWTYIDKNLRLTMNRDHPEPAPLDWLVSSNYAEMPHKDRVIISFNPKATLSELKEMLERYRKDVLSQYRPHKYVVDLLEQILSGSEELLKQEHAFEP